MSIASYLQKYIMPLLFAVLLFVIDFMTKTLVMKKPMKSYKAGVAQG